MHERLHPPEQETIAFFAKRLKAGDTIADIGANIGYYTLLFSSLVGENGRVVSFEPSPHAFNLLTKATRAKKNVTCVNKGVFSRHDSLTLYNARPGDPMGSFMYERGAPVGKIEVIPLSEYPLDFDWAKIDVEGAEIEVLKGMKRPIRAVLEVARKILVDRGSSVEGFIADIEALGYRVHLIIANGETVPYAKDTLPMLCDNIYIEPRATETTEQAL
jgi:FkbM family methyltransferase